MSDNLSNRTLPEFSYEDFLKVQNAIFGTVVIINILPLLNHGFLKQLSFQLQNPKSQRNHNYYVNWVLIFY